MLIKSFEKNRPALDVLSGMHPMGRIGTPDEVANVAIFLASAEAAFLSGAVLGVDGGMGGRLHDPV